MTLVGIEPGTLRVDSGVLADRATTASWNARAKWILNHSKWTLDTPPHPFTSHAGPHLSHNSDLPPLFSNSSCRPLDTERFRRGSPISNKTKYGTPASSNHLAPHRYSDRNPCRPGWLGVSTGCPLQSVFCPQVQYFRKRPTDDQGETSPSVS